LRLSQQGKFKRIPGYLAFWREHESSTSIALRGVAMANERIDVIKRFLNEHNYLPNRLKRMALSSAYYQAALLVYFDREIPAKKLLFRAFYSCPNNIYSFEWKVMLYILMTPFSQQILKISKRLGFFEEIKGNA
jgi:hypothetical protein